MYQSVRTVLFRNFCLFIWVLLTVSLLQINNCNDFYGWWVAFYYILNAQGKIVADNILGSLKKKKKKKKNTSKCRFAQSRFSTDNLGETSGRRGSVRRGSI